MLRGGTYQIVQHGKKQLEWNPFSSSTKFMETFERIQDLKSSSLVVYGTFEWVGGSEN